MKERRNNIFFFFLQTRLLSLISIILATLNIRVHTHMVGKQSVDFLRRLILLGL